MTNVKKLVKYRALVKRVQYILVDYEIPFGEQTDYLARRGPTADEIKSGMTISDMEHYAQTPEGLFDLPNALAVLKDRQ